MIQKPWYKNVVTGTLCFVWIRQILIASENTPYDLFAIILARVIGYRDASTMFSFDFASHKPKL